MIKDEIVIAGRRAMLRSYAKINLVLDVTGRRENGYHDVEMIMQTVSLFDLIIIDKMKKGISISTNLRYLPNNEKNIAYKAAVKFFEKTGIKSGVKIMIHKNIPVAAGLAGGSGNCAAVLLAMNILFGAGLSERELCSIGAELGADVPYCIKGGTQLSKGIGEILTPLHSLGPISVLLVKPPIAISTKDIYEKIDNATILKRPDINGMINAIEKEDINAIANNLCNVMEAVTQTEYPVIGEIKNKMLKSGALGAVMSGSGPTVFGIFDDEFKAKQAADDFSLQFKDVFLTKTYN